MNKTHFVYHPEVAAALQQHKPVVALESTLITHGFDFPRNLNVARMIEEIVRSHGAIPATIAILHGKIIIGLTDGQLEYLAHAENVQKCSVRDLPLVLAGKQDGGTTVAATMIIAHRAGIPVFATGGIGGVHRQSNWDVSADLMELGRVPITVVCAGLKAFLDIPASLEYLETQTVPVLGYQTAEFPAFFSRQSGLPVDLQVESPEGVATVIHARDAMQLPNAILVTVPVPRADEWPVESAQPAIEAVLQQAEANHIKGKHITPFVLAKIAQLSDGQSVQANVALLINNAAVAAQIAVALSALTPAI